MELAALEHKKVPIDLQCLSGERSLPFGLFVLHCFGPDDSMLLL